MHGKLDTSTHSKIASGCMMCRGTRCVNGLEMKPSQCTTAQALQTQLRYADILARFADVTLDDWSVGIPRPKLDFREWYLNQMLIFATGKERNALAVAILRETFTCNPLLIYPYRAHYGDAYQDLIDNRESDYLINYRHLVMANIDAVTDFQKIQFASLLRRRYDLERVTIVTSFDARAIEKLPEDLDAILVGNTIRT